MLQKANATGVLRTGGSVHRHRRLLYVHGWWAAGGANLCATIELTCTFNPSRPCSTCALVMVTKGRRA